jgi:hypothetical protein
MRILSKLAALFALLFANPASAAITARYSQSNGEPPVVVQIADNGDSRVTVTEAAYVTTGGIVYMIMSDPHGQFVVRQDIFLGLMDEMLRATRPASRPDDRRLAIAERGTETVAGRTGALFRISMPGNPSDAFEIVVSADPELAPLGRAMMALLVPFSVTMSRETPGFGAAFSDVLGRGTVLRLGPLWRLENIDSAPVPPSAFTLPSAPLSRDELLARLRANAPS